MEVPPGLARMPPLLKSSGSTPPNRIIKVRPRSRIPEATESEALQPSSGARRLVMSVILISPLEQTHQISKKTMKELPMSINLDAEIYAMTVNRPSILEETRAKTSLA
jgi:hypothetical protein